MIHYRANVMYASEYHYQVPDVRKITGAKYRWITRNKDPGTVQAECCFEYPDTVDATADLQIITQKEYDAFAKVILTADKTRIKPDGEDSARIKAKFPEGGGMVSFFISSRGTNKTVEMPIPESGLVALPGENVTATASGTIRIDVHSGKWHSTRGLGSVSVEVI
jgi:hypothetical protein